MKYHNFDLSMDNRVEGGYPIRVDSEFGEARIIAPFNPQSLNFQEKMSILENRSQIDEPFLVHFGTGLFRDIFQEKILKIFNQCYIQTKGGSNDTGVRLRLKIEPPEMAALPWELLYFPDEKRFMGASIRTPVVRYMEMDLPMPSLEVKLPLKMLVAVPGPISTHAAIQSPVEKENLLNILGGMGDVIRYTVLDEPVTIEKIDNALIEDTYHCFHFIGHGDFIEDRGVLLLNGPDSDVAFVDDEQLARLFHNHPPMKLAVLNSCKGAEVSSSRPFTGMAQKLVEKGVPAVIAMQFNIYDDSAVAFSKKLYHVLFKSWNSGRIDFAMSHARCELCSRFPGDRDIGAPVLYMRAKNGVLFNPVSGSFFKDMPFTSRKLRKQLEVEKEYRESEAFETDETNIKGREGLAKRIAYGKCAAGVTAASALLMFILLWINFFDLLGLDTQIETCTILIGDPFVDPAGKAFSDDIVLIEIGREQKVDVDWRRERHPLLLKKLSEAGAGVVAFDMFFEKETPHDEIFARAIKEAKKSEAAGNGDGNGDVSGKSKKTEVIVGYRALAEGRPKIAEKIRLAVGDEGAGFLCVGKKIGIASTAPMAIKKKGQEEYRLFSLSLGAYMALKGLGMSQPVQSDQIELENRETRDSKTIAVNEPTVAGKSECKQTVDATSCCVIEKDDFVADLLIDLTPLSVLRNIRSRYGYDEVLGEMSVEKLRGTFEGKIVIVGAKADHDKFTVYQGLKQEQRYGFELHADALNTIIKGMPIRSMGKFRQGFIMILLAIAGICMRALLPDHSGKLKFFSVFAFVVSYFIVTIMIYAHTRIIFNPLYHIGTFIVAFWTATFIKKRTLS